MIQLLSSTSPRWLDLALTLITSPNSRLTSLYMSSTCATPSSTPRCSSTSEGVCWADRGPHGVQLCVPTFSHLSQMPMAWHCTMRLLYWPPGISWSYTRAVPHFMPHSNGAYISRTYSHPRHCQGTGTPVG